MTSSCQEVLGFQNYRHKEWISAETIKKVQERKEKKAAINKSRTRAEKTKTHAENTDATRNVKQSLKADKANYIETLAAEAEKASHIGNMQDLYNITRKLSGKYKKSERPVKDKNGESIMEEEMQKRSWKEYFEELLNRPAPQDPPDIPAATIDLPIDIEAPTKEEIRKALMQLKNNKTTGPDSVPA